MDIYMLEVKTINPHRYHALSSGLPYPSTHPEALLPTCRITQISKALWGKRTPPRKPWSQAEWTPGHKKQS